MELEEVDEKILKALLEDASLSSRQIAKNVGVSVGTVLSRIKKMEEEGDRVARPGRRLGEEHGLVGVGSPRRVLVGQVRELGIHDIDGVIDVGDAVHIPGVAGVDRDEVLVAALVRGAGS